MEPSKANTPDAAPEAGGHVSMNDAIYRLGGRAHALTALRMMIDAHTLVSITDTRRRIAYINDRFCEVSGYSRKELLGQTHDMLHSGYHPPEFYDEIWQAVRAGKVWSGDIQNRAKDGSVFWVQCTISPIYGDDNEIVGFGSVRTDVTAQRTAMAVLEDSERRAVETLRSAIDVLDNSVNVYDSDYRLIIANKKTLEMYPEAADIIAPGCPATDILARIEPSLAPEEVGHKIAAHMTSERIAYRELSDRRVVRITRTPTPEGGMISVHTDITDLIEQKKLLERQASAMDIMKSIAVDANESADTEAAYKACLTRICRFTGWEIGHVYKAAEDGSNRSLPTGNWVCLDSGDWPCRESEAYARFRELTERTEFEAGNGLPGRVIENGAPAWVKDVRIDPNFPRAEAAKQSGLVGGAVFPVTVRGNVVAALEFYSTRPIEPSQELEEILSHVCAQVARVAEREAAERSLIDQVNAEIERRDQELITQNERFNAALEHMSQGLCMFDKDQKLIVANVRYAEIYDISPAVLKPGISLREIVQHRIDNGFYSGQSPEAYIEERMKWVSSKEPRSKTQTLNDGRTIAISYQPMDDGGWLTTHEDITGRVESEKALQESQELLAKAFSASPAAMAISHLEDGSHIEVNETWCNKLGYTRDDAMAHSAVKLAVWADPKERERFISKLKESRSIHGYEAKYRRKDGQLLDVIVSGELVEVDGNSRLLIVWHDITERVKAERALKESQHLFSKAFRASPVAMTISMLEDGLRLDVNDAWVEMIGYTREEALKKTANELQVWADPQDRVKFIDGLRQDGSVRGFEAKLHAKDGRQLDTLLFSEKVEIDGMECVLVVVYDITKRKKAEEALRESEKRFKSLVESTNVVPWEFDPAVMRFTYVGPQAVSMFGYSVEQWMSEGFWESVIHPDDREITVETCMVATRKGEDHDFEYRLIKADGQVCWVRDVVSVIMKDGEPVGLRGILIDVSERMKARHALEHSEQRFKDIVEISSDWIWECDADLRFTYLSERFAEVAGAPTSTVIGKTRYEIGKTTDADWAAHIADLEARRPFRGFCYSMNTPNGLRHWSVSGRPVFDSKGNFKGYRGTGYDRTTTVEAEEELIRHRDHLQDLVNEATAQLKEKADDLRQALAKEKEMNELQRQFLSMASHEFRTPLAIIDSSAQRLLRRGAGANNEKIDRRIEKIRSAVSRMTQLMESTLAAARIEEGNTTLSLERIDVGCVVRLVCEQHSEIAENHTIACDAGTVPAMARADRTALEQVFSNLISNAIKYSPDAGKVDVSICCQDDTVIVSVRDYGVGIDRDELPKMFQRFFRARTSSGIAGTGIGLNLVKTLIELHEGTVSVESTPGAGSTFTVRLPVGGPKAAQGNQEHAA